MGSRREEEMERTTAHPLSKAEKEVIGFRCSQPLVMKRLREAHARGRPWMPSVPNMNAHSTLSSIC